jgi:hypothetical protein
MTDDTDECLIAALALLPHGLIPIPCHFAVLLDCGYRCTCGRIDCKGEHLALSS